MPEVSQEDLDRTGANISKALDINVVELNPEYLVIQQKTKVLEFGLNCEERNQDCLLII